MQASNYLEDGSSKKNILDRKTIERSTVIVSPSQSSTKDELFFNAASTSQDSASSDDDSGIKPTIHKVFIKPKSAAAPIINQKATAMMVIHCLVTQCSAVIPFILPG